MTPIILNSTKKKILKHIAFSVLNKSDGNTFPSNREQTVCLH